MRKTSTILLALLLITGASTAQTIVPVAEDTTAKKTTDKKSVTVTDSSRIDSIKAIADMPIPPITPETKKIGKKKVQAKQNVVSESFADSISGSTILKASIVAEIALAAFAFVYIRRRRLKKRMLATNTLKKNILSLRKEKVRTGEDTVARKKREKLIAMQGKKGFNDINRTAKKLEVSTGELQLLNKIKFLNGN